MKLYLIEIDRGGKEKIEFDYTPLQNVVLAIQLKSRELGAN